MANKNVKAKSKQELNNKNKKDDKSKTNPVPVFNNPLETIWGKIIVWVLIFGFAGLIIASVIIALVS